MITFLFWIHLSLCLISHLRLKHNNYLLHQTYSILFQQNLKSISWISCLIDVLVNKPWETQAGLSEVNWVLSHPLIPLAQAERGKPKPTSRLSCLHPSASASPHTVDIHFELWMKPLDYITNPGCVSLALTRLVHFNPIMCLLLVLRSRFTTNELCWFIVGLRLP